MHSHRMLTYRPTTAGNALENENVINKGNHSSFVAQSRYPFHIEFHTPRAVHLLTWMYLCSKGFVEGKQPCKEGCRYHAPNETQLSSRSEERVRISCLLVNCDISWFFRNDHSKQSGKTSFKHTRDISSTCADQQWSRLDDINLIMFVHRLRVSCKHAGKQTKVQTSRPGQPNTNCRYHDPNRTIRK